jgi:molybdopterin-guanine dinucleotide biosynthesis protein A
MSKTAFTAVLLLESGDEMAGLVHPNGLPFWQHQVHVLEQVEPDYIMVVSRTEPSWISEEIIWVKAVAGESAPVRGIEIALNICPTSHLICLGMGMVSVLPADLTYLATCSSKGTGMVPNGEVGWMPWAAVLPREALEDMSEFLDTGDHDVQHLMDHLQHRGKIRPYPIPSHEADHFLHIRTRKDYDAWTAV